MVDRRPARASGLVLALVLATRCASTAPVLPENRFDREMAGLEKRCGCRIGVAASHLESGKSYAYRGDEVFESASVIKIAVLTEAMARVKQGEIDLSGVSGTPTFFINDLRHYGAYDIATLSAAVKAPRAKLPGCGPRWKFPTWTECSPPPTSSKTFCCSARWRTRSSSGR